MEVGHFYRANRQWHVSAAAFGSSALEWGTVGQCHSQHTGMGHCGNAYLVTYGCGVLWGIVEVSPIVLGYRALCAVLPNYTQGWDTPQECHPWHIAKGHYEALPPHVHSHRTHGTPLPRSDMGMEHQAAVSMHGS